MAETKLECIRCNWEGTIFQGKEIPCPECDGKGYTVKIKKALYLDDVRTPTKTIPGYEPWEVVRSYAEFIKWIEENGLPDLISFDHDLADEHMIDYANQVAKMGWQAPAYEEYKEKTGLDCAKWLSEHVQNNHIDWFPVCGVHSHNPVGAKNIQDYINGFKKYMGWERNCYLAKPEFTTIIK